MASVTPEFHFDFGSPNAYLSHLVIPAIEARTGAAFKYVPVLLGGVFKLTNNRSPMEAFGGVKNKLAFMEKETQRFLKRHGITAYERNPFFPVNTLAIMRGAVAADMDGALAPYAAAVFRHMWAEPKKMDDPAVIKAALTSSGLDADRLMGRMQDADVKEKLLAQTNASVERGTFGSPTFYVGDEMFFGKDQLRDVEEEIARVTKAR